MAEIETPRKLPARPGSSAAKSRLKDLLFQKVAIFVDAENIETSGLRHHEGRTDYKKILDQVGDREIIRILYYKPIYKEISDDFEKFWASLGGEIKRPTKNADTFLVIDAVTMAEKIDVAIILGGDKDFLPLMWYLRSRGCRVEIWSWPETTSPEMKEAADYYMPLTEEFVMKSTKRPNVGGAEASTATAAQPQKKAEGVSQQPPMQSDSRQPQKSSGRGGGRGGGSRGGGGRGGGGGGRGGSGGNRGGSPGGGNTAGSSGNSGNR
jgi:uncharacterized LabA/DUF88 family protein